MNKKNEFLRLVIYFVGIIGGTLWGAMIGLTFTINSDLTATMGGVLGAILAYSYSKW